MFGFLYFLLGLGVVKKLDELSALGFAAAENVLLDRSLSVINPPTRLLLLEHHDFRQSHN